jgi:hypothetical protein
LTDRGVDLNFLRVPTARSQRRLRPLNDASDVLDAGPAAATRMGALLAEVVPRI